MASKRKQSKAPAESTAPAEPVEVVEAFKGFDQTFACRGYQFEIGGSYKHEGPVEACSSGFHACEHPLNVFGYYPPATSRYAKVELRGPLSRHGDDTKIAAAEITIKAELRLPELVAAAVKWVFDRAKWSEGPVATGLNEGATASGAWGAATASGAWGAATASGAWGAATASGDQGAATASGHQGAATASGAWGAATASGYGGRVRGSDGCALFLVERDDDYNIIAVWAGIAGRDGIKTDTYYRLQDGKPVEVQS